MELAHAHWTPCLSWMEFLWGLAMSRPFPSGVSPLYIVPGNMMIVVSHFWGFPQTMLRYSPNDSRMFQGVAAYHDDVYVYIYNIV